MITKNFEEAVASWQKRVVVKKGKDSGDKSLQERQVALTTAAKKGMSALVEYLREQLGFTNWNEILEAKQEVPMLLRRLSVSEAKGPPVVLEQEIAGSYSAISAADAARPAFWTAMHIIWAEEELLEEGWSTNLVAKNDDDTARNICRNLGGLPHIRGKVSVLVNCPLARAWWRVRMARRIVDASEKYLSFDTIHGMLHRSQVWRILAEELVRRLAVMNEPRALAAIFTFFDKENREVNKKNVQNMIHRMASYSTVINFSVAPFEDMMELCSRLDSRGLRGPADAGGYCVYGDVFVEYYHFAFTAGFVVSGCFFVQSA